MTYRVVLTATARRALTDRLPEAVAVAAWEFVHGPLADNPHRVGKALSGPFEGLHGARRGDYRIIYRITESRVLVTVVNVDQRADVYRA